MKKLSKTKIFGGISLLLGLFLLSSCTANFCSGLDNANMIYPYDQGVTVYCDKDEIPDGVENATPVFTGNDTLYCYVPLDKDGNFSAKKATFINSVITTAKTKGYPIPSNRYFAEIDQFTVAAAVAKSDRDPLTVTADDINPYVINDTAGETDTTLQISDSALRVYGYLKFWGYGTDAKLWDNWTNWTAALSMSSEAGLGPENCPNSDFITFYKAQIETKLNGLRTCIATRDGNYGHFGSASDWQASLVAKDWSYAFSKGFLEGLLIYPVAYMVDTFAYAFDPSLTGWGQIWSIILVTLIVRAFLMLCTFKTTLGQQKMQALQPQLAKIQQKYPNSNTNQAQKQRLAQEQMALYKRNKINPMGSILVMLIQFPIFICVWGALQGSAVLSSGAVLNLRLSDTISSVLFNFTGSWATNGTGWWTALILFLLMSVSQWVSMMLPQWITKHRNKGMPKLSKNPAQDKSAKTMKWVTYGMLIFTIIMGFALPAAMGVYWFIGAIISMLQTVIMQAIMARQMKSEKR